MNGLFVLLYNGLPVAPSQQLPSGAPSRGWTPRADRLNGNAVRFDWIHGSNPDAAKGNAEERAALRDDVLAAAARIAVAAGFKVKADGIGLTFVAQNRTRPRT